MNPEKCEVRGCRRSAYYLAWTYSKNVPTKVCTEHAEQMRKLNWRIEPLKPVARVAPEAIKSFRGEFKFLANVYPVAIEYEGLEYPSVEHAFQAAQTLVPQQRVPFALSTVTASSAKRMGRKLDLRPDWEANKLKILTDLIAIKFADPELRALLLATDDRELIASNRHNDQFWGVCNGKGQNELGKILMAARSALRTSDARDPSI